MGGKEEVRETDRRESQSRSISEMCETDLPTRYPQGGLCSEMRMSDLAGVNN